MKAETDKRNNVTWKKNSPKIGYIIRSERENICKKAFSFPSLSGVIFDTWIPLETKKSLKELIDISLKIIMRAKINKTIFGV